jgi:hypothetical protein
MSENKENEVTLSAPTPTLTPLTPIQQMIQQYVRSVQGSPNSNDDTADYLATVAYSLRLLGDILQYQNGLSSPRKYSRR